MADPETPPAPTSPDGDALAVEVKAIFPARPLEDWLATLSGRQDRRVWFFDSPAQDLRRAGLVLRLRAGEKKGDFTVKVRGVGVSDELLHELQTNAPAQDQELEQEIDVSRDQEVPALALSADDRAWSMGALGDDPPGPRALLTHLQTQLYAGARPPVALDSLRRWGPVEAARWKVPLPGLELVVERWAAGGAAVVELSLKGRGDAAPLLARLQGQAVALGVAADELPGGKTSWAMDALSGT
jgi:hypothetical protein